MKTRKILPLIILAVGALLLSSCDAMLDAIFASNQISVEVRIYRYDYPNDWGQTYYNYLNSGVVGIDLYDTNDGTHVFANSNWSSVDSLYVYYDFNFTGLKDHVFTVTPTYTSYYTGGGPWFLPPVFITPHDATGHSASVVMTF